MTINEAILRLIILAERECQWKFKNNVNALMLAIEALKREQLLRSEIPYDREGLLPGETEGQE